MSDAVDVASPGEDALVCVTRQVDDPGPLLDLLPPRDAVAWVRGGDGMVGVGTALRVDLSPGPGRFASAAARFEAFVARLAVDDGLALPGTGPVAFGSFTFADDAVGSVLLVPSVVVGRRSGVAWVTRIGTTAEVAAAFAGSPLPPRHRPRHEPDADRPRTEISSQ